MKCNRSEQLIDYLENRLSASESSQLEKHLEDCPDCQEQLEQLMEHMDDFEHVDDSPGTELPGETFKQEILAKVDPYVTVSDLKPARPHTSVPQPIERKNRSMGIWGKVTVGVAILAVVISVGTFVSPTFANYVKSLFRTDEKVDTGLQKAAEQGYSRPISLKVTNQGITVEVKEVLADPTRIALILDIRDKDGKKGYVRLGELFNSYNNMDVKDNEGNSKMTSLEVEDYDGYAIVQFNVADPSLDQLVVQLDYEQIGDKKGNWQLQVPIDMKKAKAALRTINIGKKYDSPQGLIIHLKTVELAPSLTRLTLETNLTQPVMKEKKDWLEKERRMRNDLQPVLPADVLAQYRLAYDLVDKNGTIVAAHDLAGDETTKNTVGVLNEINTNPSTGGRIESNEFFPLPNNQELLFRLRAVYINEPAKLSTKINLQDVEKQPIIARDTAGNTFIFTGIAWDEETEGEGSADAFKKAVISFDGTLVNDVIPNHFSAAFDGNKEYPVQLRVAGKKLNADGSIGIYGTLEVWATNREWGKKQPNEIVLNYDRLTRRYRDVNWEVPINLNQQANLETGTISNRTVEIVPSAR